MNMVDLGYVFAGVLIAMVVAVHGTRILRARNNRLNDGGAEGTPAVRYN